MNNQEIFDKAAAHLLKQNMRATPTDDMGSCKYRVESEDGIVLKCAVGALIPDELYEYDMEDQCVDSLLQYFPKVKALFDKESVELLSALQGVHDDDNPYMWPISLGEVAEKFNLETTVLEESSGD